jgi:hypothetical protein
MLTIVLRPVAVGLAALLALAGGPASVIGQAPTESASLQAFAKQQLELSNSEATSLSEGRPIVKTLEATVKREMTTAGGIRIDGASMAKFVEQFKTLEGFRTSQFILQVSKFSEQPKLADLDALVLDAADLDSLRKCRVGSCDVQLSAEDIRRFSTDVQWQLPSATAQATALYKSILFRHLSDYRAGGGSRLVAYHDQEQPMVLATETAALLDARPSLLDHAPALQDYIRRFPAVTLPNTYDFYYWSKEAFGFKPVVGLNHVSVHSTTGRGDVLIVTTQIYASHYIEGSVAVNAVMPDPRGGKPGFLWLYMNRSRVGRLAGLIGTLSRPIMQRKARAGLTKSLQQTKQRLEAGQ